MAQTKASTPQIGKRVVTEKEREIQVAQETAVKNAGMLLEIAEHVSKLTSHGFYCEVMFDAVRSLYGSPPTCGVTVADLRDPATKRTLLMIRPNERGTNIYMVISELRKLTGAGADAAQNAAQEAGGK